MVWRDWNWVKARRGEKVALVLKADVGASRLLLTTDYDLKKLYLRRTVVPREDDRPCPSYSDSQNDVWKGHLAVVPSNDIKREDSDIRSASGFIAARSLLLYLPSRWLWLTDESRCWLSPTCDLELWLGGRPCTPASRVFDDAAGIGVLKSFSSWCGRIRFPLHWPPETVAGRWSCFWAGVLIV